MVRDQNADAAVGQVSHQGLDVADRAYIIYSGEVLMEGRAEDIVNNPDVRRLYLGEEFRL